MFDGIYSQKNQQKTYRMPAEWERHQAVWVNHRGYHRDTVVDKMVMALHKQVAVICRTPSDSIADMLIDRYREMGADLKNIGFITIEGVRRVVRDRGPIFVKDQFDSLSIVDFNFAWSYPYNYDVYDGEKNYSKNIGGLFNIPVFNSELVHEGGAIEINESGTVLQVEKIMKHHNPQYSKKDIEKRLNYLIGAKRVIWLKDGLATDPQDFRIVDNKFALGVGGHIDEFARFVNDTTIFIHNVDIPEYNMDTVMRLTAKSMKTNLQILENARRLDGKSYTIVKIPVPYYPPKTYIVQESNTVRPFDLIREKYPDIKPGDTLFQYPTVSYMNYFITNNLVLLPKYGDDPLNSLKDNPAKREEVKTRLKFLDEYVRQQFKAYFPNRKIVQINPIGLNWFGGGIHCWSQQMPTGKF